MLVYLLSLIESEGDKEIFVSMFKQYERKAYTVCHTILDSQPDAEDAVMGGWVKVIEHLDTAKRYFVGSEPIFEPWLITIMKNTATDEWRKKKRAPIPMEIWDTPAVDTDATDPESEFRMMIDMIHSMPPQMRTVLEMRLVTDYSFKEIGKSLRCSEDAAEKRFVRAKAELLKRLGKTEE